MEVIDGRLSAFPDAPLRAALATDTGRHREKNEDSVGVYQPDPTDAEAPLEVALVVADGVGGHEGGQQASRFVVDAVHDTIAAQGAPIEPLKAWMDRLLRSIHQELLTEARSRGTPAAMGSTATVAAIRGRTMTLAHVGDSRAYRLRNDHLEQLTRDDSWVEEQKRAGVLSDDDPEATSRKNVLTQCLGIGVGLKVQILEEALSAGDRYLLCSDGLHGVVADRQLRDELAARRSPEAIAARLIELANERGGPDNISAVVFDIGTRAADPETTRQPASPRPTPAAPVAPAPRSPAPLSPTRRASSWLTGTGAVLLMLGAGSWMSDQVSARATPASGTSAEPAPSTTTMNPAGTSAEPAAPRAATPSDAGAASTPVAPPAADTLAPPPDSVARDTLSSDTTAVTAPVPDTTPSDTTARPDTTLTRSSPTQE